MSDNIYFVGDLVKIKDKKTILELAERNKITFGWHPNMYEWCGKVFEISEITPTYILSANAYMFKDMPDEMKQYKWSEDMFEPYIRITEPQESEIVNLLL